MTLNTMKKVWQNPDATAEKVYSISHVNQSFVVSIY